MWLVGLEVVVIGVELDEEAIWEDCHAADDAENDVADCLLDEEGVGDVGGISEVELEIWRVDERDLGGTDLVLNVSTYSRAVTRDILPKV